MSKLSLGNDLPNSATAAAATLGSAKMPGSRGHGNPFGQSTNSLSWELAGPFCTSIWKVDRHEQCLAVFGNKGPDNGYFGAIWEHLLAYNRRVWEIICSSKPGRHRSHP